MRPHQEPSPRAPGHEPSPFELWFGKSLKLAFEPVLHEPISRAILEALPPAHQG